MPFTVSHAVVAVALRRTRIPLAAVAIGAMVPDVAVFFPEWADYGVMHSPLGLVFVGVPLTLALTLTWWWIARPSFALLSAAWLRWRLPSEWFRPQVPPRSLTGWFLLTAGAALGAASHAAWDSFTHASGWMAANLPVLRDEVFGLPIYRLAQYGSSVAGLVGVAAVLVLALRRAPLCEPPTGPSRRLRVAFWVVAASVLALASVAGAGLGMLFAFPPSGVVVAAVLMVGRSSLLIALIGAITIARWLWTRSRRALRVGALDGRTEAAEHPGTRRAR